MSVVLTKHAIKRGRERLGWPRSATERMAARALQCGQRVCDADLSGWASTDSADGAELMVFSDVIFAFGGTTDDGSRICMSLWHVKIGLARLEGMRKDLGRSLEQRKKRRGSGKSRYVPPMEVRA